MSDNELSINIDNYDPTAYHRINSPTSLKAMKILELNMSHLAPKTREVLLPMVAMIAPENPEEYIDGLIAKSLQDVERFRESIRAVRYRLLREEQERAAIQSQIDQVQRELDLARGRDLERIRRINLVNAEKEYFEGRSQDFERVSSPTLSRVNYHVARSERLESSMGRGRVNGSDWKLAAHEESVRKMEEMINFELYTKKMKEKNIVAFNERIERKKEEMDAKLRKFRSVMTVNERQQEILKFQKHIEKEVKHFTSEINRNAYEYQRKRRIEAIVEEEHKIHNVMQEKKHFLQQKEKMKETLRKDLISFKQGKLGMEDIESKYGHLREKGEKKESVSALWSPRGHSAIKMKESSGGRILSSQVHYQRELDSLYSESASHQKPYSAVHKSAVKDHKRGASGFKSVSGETDALDLVMEEQRKPRVLFADRKD